MDQKLKFKLSDADRWMTCTASPAATAGVTGEVKKYTSDGTVAHELHGTCLSLGVEPRTFIGESIEVKDLGQCKIDAETADAVEQSLQYIADHVPAHWQLFVEQRITIDWIIPGQSGVLDVAAFDPDDCSVLHIMDYKHGKGVKVFAEKNGQLMLYALGATRSLLTLEQRTKLQKVVLHVLQPRIGHLDSWEVGKGELERFAVEVHGKYLEALDAERRKFVPSVDGCTFCPIKHDCRALKDSIFAKLLEDPNGIGMELKDPERMTVDELAAVFPWLPFISAWPGNVERYMTRQAVAGVEYPETELHLGRGGDRHWKDRDAAEQHMREQGLADFEMFEQTLVSVSKYEKQVGKKNVGEGFEALVSRNPGSPKLVKKGTPGIPYQRAELSEFDNLTSGESDE